MSQKIPNQRRCPCGQRHSFTEEHDADKTLGRIRTKRKRQRGENLRGMEIEHRVYECSFGNYHLTTESRRAFTARQDAPA